MRNVLNLLFHFSFFIFFFDCNINTQLEAAKTEKNRWELVEIKNDGSQLYVDKKSISFLSKNIAQVKTKLVLPKDLPADDSQQILHLLKQLGIQYMLFLYEIDCSKNTIREMSMKQYGKGDKLIIARKSEGNWDSIIQGTPVEKIRNIVCRKRK